MDEIRLSHNASTLLYAMYKAYKKQKQKGVPKEDAAIFGSTLDIQQEVMPKWALSDIYDACAELCDEYLLDCVPGDDDIQMAILTSDGIKFAENRYANGVKTIWSLIKEIFSIIPFWGA